MLEFLNQESNYPVSLEVGTFCFPTKIYGNISLPAGNYEALREINIPTTVTHIERNCFENCTSIRDIVIPEGVSSIGYKDFGNVLENGNEISTSDRKEGTYDLSKEVAEREYSGRNAILNRGWDAEARRYVAVAEQWDLSELEEEFNASEDKSKKVVYIEPTYIPYLEGNASTSAFVTTDFEGKTYGSFAHEIYSLYCKNTGEVANTPRLDKNGRMWINYAGRPYDYEHISLCDVVSGKVDPKIFTDCIVMVGAYATGLQDQFSVPNSADQMFGVEIHANIVQALLDGKCPVPANRFLSAVLSGLIAGVVYFISRKYRLSVSSAVAFVAVAGSVAGGVACNNFGTSFPILYAPLFSVIYYLINIIRRYLEAFWDILTSKKMSMRARLDMIAYISEFIMPAWFIIEIAIRIFKILMKDASPHILMTSMIMACIIGFGFVMACRYSLRRYDNVPRTDALIQSIYTSVYLLVIWIPLVLFIGTKILFMKKDMNWGKTAHGLVQHEHAIIRAKEKIRKAKEELKKLLSK